MTPPADALAAFDALPVGGFTGRAHGRRYIVTKEEMAGGRACAIIARQLGGRDHISANIYRLGAGTQLYPCEMPPEKVIAFLRDLVPDPRDQ